MLIGLLTWLATLEQIESGLHATLRKYFDWRAAYVVPEIRGELLPVILPCHRVIRSDGSLGQYGDDPAWKERLLALEGVRVVEGRVT